MRLLLVCVFFLNAPSVIALEFSRRNVGDMAMLAVSGSFEPGDGERFVKFSTDDKAIVTLSSSGGNLAAAIIMGEHIRMKGYSTVVPPGATCASACALAWLAGIAKGGSETSKIGFHAAADQAGDVTAAGNALVGAYLNKIGVSYKAIAYITSPAPADITWLSFAKAREIGIDIVSLDKARSSEPTGLGGTVETSRPDISKQTASAILSGDFRLMCTPLARDGRDPVVSIDVSRINNFWRVIHNASSGARYDREAQYRMTREPGEPRWFGQHLRKPDTVMRGEVTRMGGKFYYNERVIGGGELRADITARCDIDN